MPIDTKPYMQLMNYENISKFEPVYDGPFNIPVIYPVSVYEHIEEYVPFNLALAEKHPEGKGVQFFIDDYRFTRVWNQPTKYVDILKKFEYVLSPDFSLFTDFPRAMQIYNHYRKHWCGAYWQSQGIEVIPTICWSDKESFAWCFDGEPQRSVVAISASGPTNMPESKKAFLYGFDAMMERLQPELVLYFGKNVVSKRYSDRIVPVANLNMDRMHGEVTRKTIAKKRTRAFIDKRAESLDELLAHFHKEYQNNRG